MFSGDALAEPEVLLERVKSQPSMLGADLAGEVSTTSGYVVEPTGGEARFTVAAIDLGIKTNTPRMFAERGIRVHVLPSDATLEQILDLKADGVFLSNGPGDPATADGAVHLTKEVIGQGLLPVRYLLRQSDPGPRAGPRHLQDEIRSPRNQRPGDRTRNRTHRDHRTESRVRARGEAGQEFDTPFGRAVISHTCANDGAVEGVRLLDGSAFSVQYHPEAAAGPHDAAYLFDRFTSLLEGVKK